MNTFKKTLQIRISEDDKQRLKALAESNNTTLSQLVRTFVKSIRSNDDKKQDSK